MVLSVLKQNLKIMKKSRIFNFTGSIQYFIGSIQVPNSQNFFFESISFRKKNRDSIRALSAALHRLSGHRKCAPTSTGSLDLWSQLRELTHVSESDTPS